MNVHRVRLKYLMLLISEAFSRLPYSFDFQTGFEIKFCTFDLDLNAEKPKPQFVGATKKMHFPANTEQIFSSIHTFKPYAWHINLENFRTK